MDTRPAAPTTAKRFAEERERLGYESGLSLANALNVVPSTISKIERGNASPSFAILATFASLGADVVYLLTGTRSTPLSEDIRDALDLINGLPCACQPETETLAGHTCQRCRLLKKLRGKPAAAPEGDA